jgi:G3E family GTPase
MILTLVDAKRAATQLNDRQEARRQIGFRADQIFISKTDGQQEGSMPDPPAYEPAVRARQRNLQFWVQRYEIRMYGLRGTTADTKSRHRPGFPQEEAADHTGHDHEHGDSRSHRPSAGGVIYHRSMTSKFSCSGSGCAFESGQSSKGRYTRAIVNIYGPGCCCIKIDAQYGGTTGSSSGTCIG